MAPELLGSHNAPRPVIPKAMEYRAELLTELVLVFLFNLIAHLDPALNASLSESPDNVAPADCLVGERTIRATGYCRCWAPTHDLVKHRRALPHREVAAALARVRASEPATVDTWALEFLVLTAARGGEVRGAVWTEIDREDGVWTIPASRMKANRPHRVPLCGRALEILDAARTRGGGHSRIVFVTERGQPLNNQRMCRLLEKHRIPAVPHGFRWSVRDWAAEETDHPREVIEAALAHVVRNKVEAAYRRSDLFERRRRLMEDWARYLAHGSAKDSESPR